MQINSSTNYLTPNFSAKAVVPKFKKATKDGWKVHSKLNVQCGSDKVTLASTCEKSCSSDHINITTKIKNLCGKIMGDYHYLIDPKTNTINNGYIQTNPQFRHKGVAEVMRLSSIMELKENHISAIEIDALPEAIQFHSKYNFEPNLKGKFSASRVLDRITKLPKVSKEDKATANKLLERINTERPPYTPALKPDDKKDVNNFISDYLVNHEKDWKDANFDCVLPMKLTSEQVNKHSDFFNNLYQKHGINYVV